MNKHSRFRVAFASLIFIVFSLSASTIVADDRTARVLKVLDESLTAMADFRRHDGWGVAWSLDQKVVWGEYLPIPDDWITVQSPATPTTAGIYLRAGQVLNDPRWIAVAAAAQRSLCRLQSVEGGFPHEGSPAAGPSKRGSFDDGTTTNTLNFLIDWWHHTRDPRDFAAVQRVGAFILTSQYSNTGGWPQSYPLPDNYGRCITFNDGNISNIIRALFKLERETGDVRFRNAALRGAECVLQLQGKNGQAIWAQQYDPDTLKPAWARKFEPPGYSPAESSEICNLLVELYVQTGDQRYVDSLEQALEWYETHRLANGKYARLYEPDTERPVYGRRDKAVPVYDFANACKGYGWQGNWYPKDAKKAYAQIKQQGGDIFRKSREKQPPSLPTRPTDSGVDFSCKLLTSDGHWTRQPNHTQLEFYDKHGVAPEVPMVLIRDFNAHVSRLLDYIETSQ